MKKSTKQTTLALYLAVFGLGISVSSAQSPIGSIKSEKELVAILSSSSPDGDKALACKQLAIYGSEACVPEVAKLLGSPQFSSWARIALEAISDDSSKQALRQAAETVQGPQLMGIVNSLGNLRDQSSISMLKGLLNSKDAQLGSAAALALGRIGGQAALAALQESLGASNNELQSAVAEGCLLCADAMMTAGQKEKAMEVYDQIRAGQFPPQRLVEATRGAILARGDQGVELLVEQLQSPSEKLFAVALQTTRELDSGRLGPALIAHLEKSSPQRAPLIVEALSELKGSTDIKQIERLAASGSKEVRSAAISVLGRVGNVTSVAALLDVAAKSPDLAAAVRAALVTLPDEKANDEILNRLSKAGKDKLVLLETVGLRQLEATDLLVKSLEDSDAAVRAAALQALGQTVPQSKLSTLIGLVIKPGQPSDEEAAIRAIRTAAVRMPDREACASALGQAMQSAPAGSKSAIVETIASVGGTQALKLVSQYALSKEESMRDVSTRVLGEWMTADVAPAVLDLYMQGPADRFQPRLMKGYIRVARQFVMPDPERVEMCKKVMAIAKPAEQKLVFDIVKRYPSVGMLQIAVDAMGQSGLKDDAMAAIEAIKPKLYDKPEAKALFEKAGVK